MPDITIPYNLQGRTVTFTVIDGNTGVIFNLTGATVTLKIMSTEYVTTYLTKTLTANSPTTGVAIWQPISTDWNLFANNNQSYFGQLLITAAGVNIPVIQFDVKVTRTLT